MSELVSIELLLDAASEARIRADWQALAAGGHSSLAAHTSPSNRPHVTLLVRPTLAETAFAAARALLPLPLTLGAPIVFAHGDGAERGVLAHGDGAERGVLVRPVTPTAGLVALHRSVHTDAGAGDDAPHTRPGEWTPHVTLARRLRLASLPAALAVLGGPVQAAAVSMRRWDAATRTVTPL